MAAAQQRPTEVPEVADEVSRLRHSERKLQQQVTQLRRREGALVLRLALKDRQTTQLQAQTDALRADAAPQNAQVRSLMLDPAMNAEMSKLRDQVHAAAPVVMPSVSTTGWGCAKCCAGYACALANMRWACTREWTSV